MNKFKVAPKDNAKTTAVHKTHRNTIDVITVHEVCEKEMKDGSKDEQQKTCYWNFEMELEQYSLSDHIKKDVHKEIRREVNETMKTEPDIGKGNKVLRCHEEVDTKETLEVKNILDSLYSEKSGSFNSGLSEGTYFDSYDDKAPYLCPGMTVQSEEEDHVPNGCCIMNDFGDDFQRKKFVLQKHASGKFTPGWTR